MLPGRDVAMDESEQEEVTLRTLHDDLKVGSADLKGEVRGGFAALSDSGADRVYRPQGHPGHELSEYAFAGERRGNGAAALARRPNCAGV